MPVVLKGTSMWMRKYSTWFKERLHHPAIRQFGTINTPLQVSLHRGVLLYNEGYPIQIGIPNSRNNADFYHFHAITQWGGKYGFHAKAYKNRLFHAFTQKSWALHTRNHASAMPLLYKEVVLIGGCRRRGKPVALHRVTNQKGCCNQPDSQCDQPER